MKADTKRHGCISTKWAVLEEFRGYEIGNAGEVYSTKREKRLKQYDKKGYKYVFLYGGHSKRKCVFVHRLVAMAFIENPKGLPQINHKDEDTTNNSAENLEWCSAKYNANYGNHKKRLSAANSGKNNPFYGKKHTQDAIDRMRSKKIGMPSKRRKKVSINGVIYESVSAAMKELSICTRKFYALIKEEGNGYV